MCGFAALFENERIFCPQLLAEIEADLYHRGPDSGGSVSWPGVGLVFRRLSIMDPDAASDQPMHSSDGKLTLVFNGEIYNFRQLRTHLEGKGVVFRTNGDSEVLLEGYRHWGEGIVDYLEGMYAFVIVDRELNQAFAARDPFGIKPPYLLRHGALIGMASEMHPFSRIVAAEPDPNAISELLTFGWASGNLSNLKNIELVEGGTAVSIPLSGGMPKLRRFQDPLDTFQPDESMTEAQAIELVEESVQASLNSHLMSDVGYAIELSGGVDSSLVAALASQKSNGQLSSYSINLGDYEGDESYYRDMVIQKYPMEHHEIPMNSIDFSNALPRAIRHLEGPSAHAGCVFIMRLCDEISKKHKVVLTGEGADEFLGGYHRYETWKSFAFKERISRILPKQYWPNTRPFRGVRRLAGRDAAIYSSVHFDAAGMETIFDNLVVGPNSRLKASERFDSLVDRIFAVDQTSYLQSLLMRQDKVSMAASVEARVPFTSLKLARQMNSIPPTLRAPGGKTKRLLKAMADKHLPKELVHRRKVGLQLPLAEWLTDPNSLGRYIEDLTNSNSPVRAFANDVELDKAINEFRSGKKVLGKTLFRVVNFDIWLRSLSHSPVIPGREAILKTLNSAKVG